MNYITVKPMIADQEFCDKCFQKSVEYIEGNHLTDGGWFCRQHLAEEKSIRESILEDNDVLSMRERYL